MDADVTFDAASIVTAKLAMNKVRFHLGLDNGRISLNPLSFTLPQDVFSGTVALGALLTPVAALLAFVDGGLAKDANCSASINNAEQGKNLASVGNPEELH